MVEKEKMITKKRKIITVLVTVLIVFVVSYLFKPFIEMSVGLNVPLSSLVEKEFINNNHDKMFVFSKLTDCTYTFLNDGNRLVYSLKYYFIEDSIEVEFNSEVLKFAVFDENRLFSTNYKEYFWSI